MARPRAALLAVLGMLAVGAALAAPRQFSRPDPLEGVKTAIRLKKFAEAATALQKLASAGNADAQYMLAVFYLNGVNGPRDPAQAKGWLEKSAGRSEEHTSELQSQSKLVCRLLLEKKKNLYTSESPDLQRLPTLQPPPSLALGHQLGQELRPRRSITKRASSHLSHLRRDPVSTHQT